MKNKGKSMNNQGKLMKNKGKPLRVFPLASQMVFIPLGFPKGIYSLWAPKGYSLGLIEGTLWLPKGYSLWLPGSPKASQMVLTPFNLLKGEVAISQVPPKEKLQNKIVITRKCLPEALARGSPQERLQNKIAIDYPLRSQRVPSMRPRE